MSLKVLLRCSDSEFERLISMMDLQSVLDIIAELQAEMDSEQVIFDQLSQQLLAVSDQASPTFKKISADLVKSQNRLALLLTRNFYCFKVSQEHEDLIAESEADSNNTTEGSDTVTNNSYDYISSQSDGSKPAALESRKPKTKKIVKKVVKVTSSTRIINTKSSALPVVSLSTICTTSPNINGQQRKAITSSNQIPESKHIISPDINVKTNSSMNTYDTTNPHPKTDGLKKGQSSESCDKSSSPDTKNAADSNRSISSATFYTVLSPSADTVRPKCTLKVRTTSLSSESSSNSVTPRSPNRTIHADLPASVRSESSTSVTLHSPSGISIRSCLPTEDNSCATSITVSPRTSLVAGMERSANSGTDSTVISAPDVPLTLRPQSLCELSRTPRSSKPLSSTGSQYKSNSSTPRSTNPYSPRSGLLSPRSDISSGMSSPKCPLPISSILELDIPETNVDGGNNWPGQATPNTEGAVSDKVSCTTDESGFTSASSESDITLAPPDIVYDYHSEEEEKVEERTFTRLWDPVKLLDELYTIRLAEEPECSTNDAINMEGYLERLPLGKNKNTLLKTWRRTYCRAVDGIIYFYDNKLSKEAGSYMSLMGGVVEELSNRIIGIDDMRGHYLMVRCGVDADHMNWRRSFYTQIRCSPQSTYIRPCLTSCPSPSTPVIVIDLGSTSVRAGILGTSPSYPQLFFPCISSMDDEGQPVFGFDAYKPSSRANGLHHPVASSKDVDTYRVNVQALPDLFTKIFTELNVSTADYTVLLSCPHNFSTRLKEEVINILVDRYNVYAVNMVSQSLLTPYIYNATSGIVVDIGERIEIVTITDGYLVDGGLSRQSFGGKQITDTLNTYLVEYRLFTPVEQLIARYIKEKTCFLSQDYGDDLLKYMCNDSACEVSVDLNYIQLPSSHLGRISVDTARFKAAEGLIKTELFGVDSPTLPRLIEQAIQRCPMDARREMWQSIYLSGGTTLLSGFPERLQKELGKIAPSSITIQVHASPHRYHAAYIGACMLAKMPNFANSCITRDQWKAKGASALDKWRRYFQG